MLKSSSIFLGVATAGLIVASPAIAAGLLAPTQTRSAASMPAASVASSPFGAFMVVATRRQSPLLVPPGDSPG